MSHLQERDMLLMFKWVTNNWYGTYDFILFPL